MLCIDQVEGMPQATNAVRLDEGPPVAKALTSNLSDEELRTVLTSQYNRWWSIDIDHFESKKHFLLYAGR
jgi:hypothetical protein